MIAIHHSPNDREKGKADVANPFSRGICRSEGTAGSVRGAKRRMKVYPLVQAEWSAMLFQVGKVVVS